ncbi:hypothetical protein CYMTET_37803 [Cymbomonas tetramitiformis]|uniref:Uncharacterized protein n=1 Tax=Cymbomonas tetramitiformis TaxID=36881 RepID=A0AAE0F5L1_9CHLO|nr:hypothetical protein CYMTET_37803 [Cymbomonas tetramitiformis]
MSNGNHHETVQVEEGEEIPDVNYELNRFPCAVVYQPFPPLTWLFPLIGHMGIADSQGRVHDFQGPYTIIQDRMMLGRATRYLPLDPNQIRARSMEDESNLQRWDACIALGDAEYSRRTHNLLFDNCNHHVVHCLNVMQYNGGSYHGCFTLWLWMFFCGRFVGFRGFLITLFPFLLAYGALVAMLLVF